MLRVKIKTSCKTSLILFGKQQKNSEYIYIPKDSEWDNLQQILLEAQQNGYSLSENEVSYKLVK